MFSYFNIKITPLTINITSFCYREVVLKMIVIDTLIYTQSNKNNKSNDCNNSLKVYYFIINYMLYLTVKKKKHLF